MNTYEDPDAQRERRRDCVDLWADMLGQSQAQEAAFYARLLPSAPVLVPKRDCPTCRCCFTAHDQVQCQHCIATGASDIPNTHFEIHR